MQSKTTTGNVERHAVAVPVDPVWYGRVLDHCKSLFANRYASSRSVIKTLLFVVAGLCVVCGYLGYDNFLTHEVLRHQKPWFVAQSADGSFRTIDPDSLQLRVSEDMLTRSVENFVRRFTGRKLVQGKEQYESVASAYLDDSIRQTLVARDAANVRAVWLGQEDEVDVQVLSTSIKNTRYKCANDRNLDHQCVATVITRKRYFDPSNHKLKRQVASTVDLTFVLLDKITAKQGAGMNLIGLDVTDFREHVEEAPLDVMQTGLIQ